MWLPAAQATLAKDVSQHAKYKEDLARAIAQDPDLKGHEWEEAAIVFDFEEDGALVGTAGYAYAPDRESWRAISPSSDPVKDAVNAYWAWSRQVDEAGMIGLLFQFNRESGKIRTDSEYEDRERWAYETGAVEMLIERMRPRLWN